MFGTGINERLEENTFRKKLIHHPFFEPDFSPAEIDRIVAGAEEMWQLWIAFFDRLRQGMFGTREAPAEQVAVATA